MLMKCMLTQTGKISNMHNVCTYLPKVWYTNCAICGCGSDHELSILSMINYNNIMITWHDYERFTRVHRRTGSSWCHSTPNQEL